VSLSFSAPKLSTLDEPQGGDSACSPLQLILLMPHKAKVIDPSDAPQGNAQGSTGRARAYLWDATTVVKQLIDGQRTDAQRVRTW